MNFEIKILIFTSPFLNYKLNFIRNQLWRPLVWLCLQFDSHSIASSSYCWGGLVHRVQCCLSSQHTCIRHVYSLQLLSAKKYFSAVFLSNPHCKHYASALILATKNIFSNYLTTKKANHPCLLHAIKCCLAGGQESGRGQRNKWEEP